MISSFLYYLPSFYFLFFIHWSRWPYASVRLHAARRPPWHLRSARWRVLEIAAVDLSPATSRPTPLNKIWVPLLLSPLAGRGGVEGGESRRLRAPCRRACPQRCWAQHRMASRAGPRRAPPAGGRRLAGGGWAPQ
jgi:hypothetical protein